MLQGKVAIVTGAARGLGRAEAVHLASLGATVVVNDVGAALDGGGPDDSAAQAVVDEIVSKGGTALAHTGDVADFDQAKAMIDLAVERFGALDILVNNAGILRDRMIFNMAEEEWDAVIRVHLKGHFCTTRHATAYWRERAKTEGRVYARIINTSSEAFLFGSPGQPNYAAAKAGIVGLTLATAMSCAKYGVVANAICPRAATRMTEDMALDPERFAPENVAPLVGWLASPAAERCNGYLFVAYGGQVDVIGGPRVEERFETQGRWTTQGLAEALGPFFEKREPIADGFAMPFS
ncbi:MAG TPA: SDR family NAD(P)-dependent oxidoreductase [Actinomycetota bacterium]